MAKAAGRLATLSKDSTAIGGTRVTNIQVDYTPIDVTDNDSDGLQELLALSGMSVMTFDVEGVYKDPVLRDIAMDPTTTQLLTDLTFDFADGGVGSATVSGSFFMLNYKEGNDYKEATTFSASFTSSGAWSVA